MKTVIFILSIALSAISLSNYAQKITLKGESIFYGGEPMFELKPVEHYNGAHKQLFNMSGEMIAYIMNMNNYRGKTNIYNISFPTTQQVAYVTISNGGDLKLFELLNDNGAFDNGKVVKAGVSSLASKGATVIDGMEFKDPEVQDKELKSSVSDSEKESPEEFRKRMGFSDPNEKKQSSGNNSQSANSSSKSSSTVSLSIKNNCRQSVKIFIGTKPKYGSGTTSTLGGNSVNSRSGVNVGDQLCIVDNSGNPISCMTISSSTGRVEINSAGTGF
jgi:hypothetical protein